MENEEATQPATQLIVDPRRLGQGNSGLNDEDLADICCILVPASRSARRACALVFEQSPEHTIPVENDTQVRQRDEGKENNDEGDDGDTGNVPCNIALRLGSELKDIVGGFHFGRNPDRCDVVLGAHDLGRRISNVHFRIYINEHGVIMLEDQSTNGTAVDGNMLRNKDKENGMAYRHTLSQGSQIILAMQPAQEDYRFTVRIPTRDDESEQRYQDNLTEFFLRAKHVRELNNQRVAAAAKGKGKPINLFPNEDPTQELRGSLNSASRRVPREWRGGAKYNKIGIIGKGAFAVVYKLTSKFGGDPFAAKELEKRRFMKNGVLDQKVDMEMKIMSKIQHPNIVQYIEHVDWEEYLYIIMEFVPGGDLGSLILREERLPESDVKIVATQLLGALKYLHEGGITHRDVKPDNILIARRHPFHVKLTDFGLSKMIDSEETFLRTFCGTLLYCAPEVYSEYRDYDDTGHRKPRGDKRSQLPNRYGHAVDVWSLAGVLFYALSGRPPYPVKNGTSYQELLNQIMTVPLSIIPLQESGVSDRGSRCIRGMLHVRPEYRKTIPDVQTDPWLTGTPPISVESQEEDEVDMIGDDSVDPELRETQLENEASQLSLHDNAQREIRDSDEMVDDESVSTEVQVPEIPSSFSTGDALSDDNLSYEFPPTVQNNPTNGGRLFGEVNVSAVGSSGAIASHLHLPRPNRVEVTDSFLIGSWAYPAGETNTTTEQSTEAATRTESTPEQAQTMPPPPPRPVPQHPEVDDHRSTRSSSLMGAESMVGHLNVNSPAAAASPHPDSPAPTTEEYRDHGVSLRRPREDDPDDDGLRPENMSKRQRISSRQIDVLLPNNVFWDAKDKSTHHDNYPRMMQSEFSRYQKLAESKGESFTHGHKTFEHTMQSFRESSGSSANSPEPRAYSEPTKEEGRRILMKRDERQLAEDADKENSGPPAQDANLPNTAHASNAPSPASTASANASLPTAQPVVGNDFQQPKRILGKFVSTEHSCLPTITFNITDGVLSWGRGTLATQCYSNGNEIRIPRYSFKVILFKPGFYSTSTDSGMNTRDWEEDMRFYISTKAGDGIYINKIHVSAVEARVPDTPSKFWGELRHGDLMTLWYNTKKPKEVVQLRFECNWGPCKVPRDENNSEDDFKLLADTNLISEIDQVCLLQEKAILADQARRTAEEKRIAHESRAQAKQKAKQQLSSQMSPNSQVTPSTNFLESFSVPPPKK